MTILLTGSMGKTARHIAKLLLQRQVPFIVASRKGQVENPAPGLESVTFARFDFTDPATFDLPFTHQNAGKIDSIYLVGPQIPDSKQHVNSFVDHAKNKYGVHKFVLLASQTAQKGSEVDPWGQIWLHLDQAGVDYGVLAPSVFMDNFSDAGSDNVQSIRNESKMYTSTGGGKLPAVAASDIAAVAVELLTSKEPLKGTRYPILGAEALSYKEIAASISRAADREIELIHVTAEERQQILRKLNQPEAYVQRLPQIEGRIAAGALLVGWPDDTFRKVVGREPLKFSDWAEQNKSAWQ